MTEERTLRREVGTAGDLSPAATSGKRFYNALSASSVGLELGLSVVISLLFGMWLDSKLGTQPWLMLLWLCFGLVAGFRGVLRAVNRSDRAADLEAGEVAEGSSDVGREGRTRG